MYTRSISYLLLLLLFSVFTLSSCANDTNAAQNEPNTQAGTTPVNVKVEKVVTSSLTDNIKVSAETIADKDVTFSAELSGRVEYLSADLGDRVKKGQVLARIDYEMQKAQSDQAQATFDLATKTFERLSALKKDELISQQQIDESETNLAQARAQLQIAKANLKKSIVRSSINGIVGRKFIEEGMFVGPGSPIFQVVDFKTIVIKAQLPETQVSKVKRDMAVKVDIPALGKEYDGKVHVVLPAADPVAKTFQLRVKVENPDYNIKIGMAATINIIAEEHTNVIVTRQDVVIEETGSRSVFVEKDGKAEKRTVILGPTEGSRVIIEDGLTEGESLIVLGQRDLVDGQPVVVVSD